MYQQGGAEHLELGPSAKKHHCSRVFQRSSPLRYQYAGRGGSAFADNSRGMLVMQIHKQSDKFEMPLAISMADVLAGRVMRLHVAKFSFGPREMEPLWVMRGKENSWSFNCYGAQPMDGDERVERARENIATEEEAAVDAVVAHVEAERDLERYPTKADVRASTIVNHVAKKVPNSKKYKLIEIALQQKRLVEVDLPSDLKRGQKQYFLDIPP